MYLGLAFLIATTCYLTQLFTWYLTNEDDLLRTQAMQLGTGNRKYRCIIQNFNVSSRRCAQRGINENRFMMLS